jgi:hypothetical protein
MEQRGLGNLAAAVSQIRTTEALNQLEAQNQAIKRQSLGQYASLAGQMQAIQNQNIQSFNQMLYAQQQALGQAAQAGFKNLAGTGATIAEAIEGKKAVEDKTHENTPGGKVTTGQMGVTDSGKQTSTPEGFGLDAATTTGLTESEATSIIQAEPGIQLGQVPQSSQYDSFFGGENTGIQIGQQMHQTPQLTSYSYQDAFKFSPASSFASPNTFGDLSTSNLMYDNFYDDSIGAGFTTAPTN